MRCSSRWWSIPSSCMSARTCRSRSRTRRRCPPLSKPPARGGRWSRSATASAICRCRRRGARRWTPGAAGRPAPRLLPAPNPSRYEVDDAAITNPYPRVAYLGDACLLPTRHRLYWRAALSAPGPGPARDGPARGCQHHPHRPDPAEPGPDPRRPGVSAGRGCAGRRSLPGQNAPAEGDLHSIADLLGPIVGEAPEDLYGRIQGVTATTQLLARRLDTDSTSRVRQLLNTWPLLRTSIWLDQQPRRDYPNGSFAAHVLGFADYDNQGQYGVEQFYDDKLAGEPGFVTAERDANLVPLPIGDSSQKAAIDG